MNETNRRLILKINEESGTAWENARAATVHDFRRRLPGVPRHDDLTGGLDAVLFLETIYPYRDIGFLLPCVFKIFVKFVQWTIDVYTSVYSLNLMAFCRTLFVSLFLPRALLRTLSPSLSRSPSLFTAHYIPIYRDSPAITRFLLLFCSVRRPVGVTNTSKAIEENPWTGAE